MSLYPISLSDRTLHVITYALAGQPEIHASPKATPAKVRESTREYFLPIRLTHTAS